MDKTKNKFSLEFGTDFFNRNFEFSCFGPPSIAGVYAVVAVVGFGLPTKSRVLYVGSSSCIRSRVLSRSHPYHKAIARFHGTDYMVCCPYFETQNFKEEEVRAIQLLRPEQNIQHNTYQKQ